MKYELKKESVELKSSSQISEGCSVIHDGDHEPELVKSFDSKELALLELKKYESTIDNFNSYVLFTEYYVEEADYDEDGDWIGGGDIIDFSPLPSNL